MYGVRGAGVPPAEVDHQVQLPGPPTALCEKHHTAGNKTFRVGDVHFVLLPLVKV